MDGGGYAAANAHSKGKTFDVLRDVSRGPAQSMLSRIMGPSRNKYVHFGGRSGMRWKAHDAPQRARHDQQKWAHLFLDGPYGTSGMFFSCFIRMT